MMEITNDNFNCGRLVDRPLENHARIEFKSKRQSKAIKYLLGTLGFFIAINTTLIYAFYKILISL